MKEFFAKKSAGFYASVVAVVLGIVAVCAFAPARENQDSTIVVLMILGILCSAIVAVKHFPLTEYIPLICNAAALAMVFNVLLHNLADIFAKNNVIGLSTGFILSMVFCALAAIASIVAVAAKHERRIIVRPSRRPQADGGEGGEEGVLCKHPVG